jgi:surface antigen
MKPMLLKATLLAASIGLVVGCSSTNTQSQNAALGALGGAVVGGVAGSAIGSGTGQAVAIGVGAVAGALIGGSIGSSMDHSDSTQTYYALDHSPKTYHWKNKKTGNVYTVVPSKRVKMKGYSDCRKYAIIIDRHGKKQKAYGTACRQADGSWKAI